MIYGRLMHRTNFAMQSDEAKNQATIDGKYYCVPTLLSTYNAYALIYREDLVDGTGWKENEYF